MKVYDGEGKILGRLASRVASDLLDGEEIHVVNADKVFVIGNKQEIYKDYREKRERGKQRKGPYYPRRPEKIFKRTVRGMMPYQKPRGRKAFKSLRAYVGIPSEMKDEEIIEPDIKSSKGKIGLSVGEIAEHLGAEF